MLNIAAILKSAGIEQVELKLDGLSLVPQMASVRAKMVTLTIKLDTGRSNGAKVSGN